MSHACVIAVVLSWVKVGERMGGDVGKDNAKEKRGGGRGGRAIIFVPRISFPTPPLEF